MLDKTDQFTEANNTNISIFTRGTKVLPSKLFEKTLDAFDAFKIT